MKILITGATGFIGSKLTQRLLKEGHEINVLTRNPEKARKLGDVNAFQWDYRKNVPKEALEEVEAIFHLMGENIGKRWSKKVKKEIYDSRIISTRSLVRALPSSVRAFISASAIGYYPSSLTRAYDENYIAKDPQSFLGKVCYDWEREAKKAKCRTVSVRTGIVLGDKGILSKLAPIYKMGLGGPVAGGQAWMSWIHVEDLVSIYLFCLEKNLKGAVNAVSPNAVTNKEFSRTLGKVMHRPSFFNTPSFMLKLVLGEASELLLDSCKALPKKLVKAGYKYRFRELPAALLSVKK